MKEDLIDNITDFILKTGAAQEIFDNLYLSDANDLEYINLTNSKINPRELLSAFVFRMRERGNTTSEIIELVKKDIAVYDESIM